MADFRNEALHHLTEELLPFWLDRCWDDENGGFITHFDKNGNDTGEDQKSLIAQTRMIYSLSAAHRGGYGDGRCADYARHGVRFLIERMWDTRYGGFFWTVDRAGEVEIDKKILYGQSFAVYSLSEYFLAVGDPLGLEYAELVFDLMQKYAADTLYGGYYEMFERNWDLGEAGSGGGDRKTLDVHMHLMEAFTNLLEADGRNVYRRKLEEIIALLTTRILHPEYRTGIPQFTPDWRVAPQIEFDIVWGWDRFSDTGAKEHADDNTSAGHNAELVWLLLRALDVLGVDRGGYRGLVKTILDHVYENGIDFEQGGVYVEGPHSGGVYDREKEFWQQAEMMIGMLEGYLELGEEKYLSAYKNVHRFVFDRMINRGVGEWYPLMTREGDPIWTHMSHSWKVSYHTVRCMIESIRRLDRIG